MLGSGGLIVNGYDLANQGLILEAWPGFQNSPSRRPTLTPVWGRDGGAFVPTDVRASAREATLTGVLIQSSVDTRRAAVNEIKKRLDAGELHLEMVDRPGQRLMGYATDFDFTPNGLDEVATSGMVSISLIAPSPVFEDIEPTLVTFGSTRTTVPLGTGVSTGFIQLFGPSTNPSFTYQDEAGQVRGSMTFLVTMADTDYLDINLQTSSVTYVQNGLRSYGGVFLVGGDWPVLDARDGAATIVSTNATGLLIAYRGWL